MVRYSLVFVAVVGASSFGHRAANADWRAKLDAFCQRCKLDYHRNIAWPHPFVCMDRQSVRAPFAVQTSKGWQRQNTIGRYHFDPETQQLTEAGYLKVRWIVTQAPPEHRTIFVVRGDSEAETTSRTDSIHESLARIAPNGKLPDVRSIAVDYRGWPAEEIDAIDRKIQSSRPIPQLPQFTPTTGGSGP